MRAVAHRCETNPHSDLFCRLPRDALRPVPRLHPPRRHISLRQSAIYDRLSCISFIILMQSFMCGPRHLNPRRPSPAAVLCPAGPTSQLSTHLGLPAAPSPRCYDQILLIAKERSVYRKDHDAGIYRTSSFYISRICAELPFIVLFSFIAATISYWMYGFQADAGIYLTWCVIIIVVTDAGAALLNSLGALASNFEMANLLATLVVVVLMLFGARLFQ